MSNLKPVVSRPGGKRQLLKVLRPLVRDAPCYVEPFVGGGALWLDTAPPRAVVGDADESLVDVYRACRDAPDELVDLLASYAAAHGPDLYYCLRALDRDPGLDALDLVERAARAVYLSKAGFNGLWRVNRAGLHNVAWGDQPVGKVLASLPAVRALAGYLADADVTLVGGDFEDVLAAAPAGSFVYADPPYTGTWGAYAGTWDDTDRARLRSALDRVVAGGGSFVLSEADHPDVRRLWEGYRLIEVCARRSVNRDGAGRGPVGELLVVSA